MTGPLHDTVTVTPRRADYGAVRLGRRDIDGLILCAEHFGAPYDLLAAALGAQPARLRGIVARWRRAGYAATGRLASGPAWCWLTPGGMAATGLGYPASRPALARLAHIRAVLAARLWLQVLAAIQGERFWRGCVFACERGFRGGSGCGGVACDDTVSVSDKGRPSPLSFCRSPGRAVRVLGGTIAHGRQQRGRHTQPCLPASGLRGAGVGAGLAGRRLRLARGGGQGTFAGLAGRAGQAPRPFGIIGLLRTWVA